MRLKCCHLSSVELIVYGHDIGSIVMVIHQSRCALYTHHVIYTPQLDTPRVHIYPCPSCCNSSSSSAVHLTISFLFGLLFGLLKYTPQLSTKTHTYINIHTQTYRLFLCFLSCSCSFLLAGLTGTNSPKVTTAK